MRSISEQEKMNVIPICQSEEHLIPLAYDHAEILMSDGRVIFGRFAEQMVAGTQFISVKSRSGYELIRPDDVKRIRMLTQEEAQNRKPTINDIVYVVAEHFELTLVEIHSRNRTERVVEPRQVAMYLARKARFTAHGISVHFRKNHDTVLHAERVIQDRIDTNHAFRDIVLMLADNLGIALPNSFSINPSKT